MRFVALFNLKDNVDEVKLAEAVSRRGEYEHPMTLIEEFYTPNHRPALIAVYETDDVNTLLMNSMAWVDTFEIQVFPVIQSREGLETLKP